MRLSDPNHLQRFFVLESNNDEENLKKHKLRALQADMRFTNPVVNKLLCQKIGSPTA